MSATISRSSETSLPARRSVAGWLASGSPSVSWSSPPSRRSPSSGDGDAGASAHLATTRPREAIVRAYGRFAGDASAAGVGRTPGETPVEYLARVAPQLEGTEPLDRLTALTVVAAYGRDDPTTDDALDAIADADEASRAVRRSLPWYRRWRRFASA